MQNQPIGIFDSGIGGLTVFSEISKHLPGEDLIYLGDTARVPYGTKSAETVTRYAVQNVRFLLEQKVKMVVVACNTASAFALDELGQKYSIPIVGVIEPGIGEALERSRLFRIGVIGTEGTIRSEAYFKGIQSRRHGTSVAGVTCPLFVPLVEEGRLEGEIVEKIAGDYLEPLLQKKIDTLILGCTHYPLLKKTIQKVVGEAITLIDSAEATAREVSRLLTQRNLLRRENKVPSHTFYVTDSPERFAQVGHLFLKKPLQNVHHVSL